MQQELEIIQGVISAIVYQNYDNGYAVLRLGVGGNQHVTVVGTIPLPAMGERLMVTGKWSNHSSYGTRDQTHVPSIGRQISQPLDHQGSLIFVFNCSHGQLPQI